MFKDLDPILHSQLRLAVMSLLIGVKEAEFTFLKEKTNATAGNLSVQINKLKDAGYIDVVKQFKENYPQTICKITKKGIDSFEVYINALQTYVNPKSNNEISL
jgi:DNA-binding transcriptional ArsR family regulator